MSLGSMRERRESMSLHCAAWRGTYAFNTTWAPATAMLTAEWKEPTR